MIAHRLNDAAEAAASRYDHLTQTFGALHKSALMSAEFGYAGQSQRLYAEAYEAASLYFERDKEIMNDQFHEIAEAAHQSVLSNLRSIDAENLSDAALEHLGETQTYLSSEIAAQVHRDIAQMRFSLQRAVLDVGMIERSRRIPTRQAQMALIMKEQPALDLAFTDRRGRRTPSRTFIRSAYRQALLSVHNEVTLHTIVDHGLEDAAIMKVQEGQIERVGYLRAEDYAELRDEMFHPNSNAWLEVDLKHVRT